MAQIVGWSGAPGCAREKARRRMGEKRGKRASGMRVALLHREVAQQMGETLRDTSITGSHGGKERKMFCPRCGTQILDGTTYCPTCGANLTAPARRRAQAAAPATAFAFGAAAAPAGMRPRSAAATLRPMAQPAARPVPMRGALPMRGRSAASATSAASVVAPRLSTCKMHGGASGSAAFDGRLPLARLVSAIVAAAMLLLPWANATALTQSASVNIVDTFRLAAYNMMRQTADGLALVLIVFLLLGLGLMVGGCAGSLRARSGSTAKSVALVGAVMVAALVLIVVANGGVTYGGSIISTAYSTELSVAPWICLVASAGVGALCFLEK